MRCKLWKGGQRGAAAERIKVFAGCLWTTVSLGSKKVVVPVCSTAETAFSGLHIPDMAFWFSDIKQKADTHTAGLNLGK